MQRMSVRDLDKVKTFHEKKERGFQIHSFERNNLSQTGRSQTCQQTCSCDVPQPARKEGYMPFHPFYRQL